MLRSRLSLIVCLGLMCIALAGCKSELKRYRVTGTVKYKGEPIKSGTISFRSLDGQHTVATTLVNGEYDIAEANGLPVGKYQVAVSYPDPKAPPATAASPDGLPGDSMAVAAVSLGVVAADESKSELTAEIKAEPRNEVSFDLK
jgi:hypothetical protein